MKRGDQVPEFELPDQTGTVRSLTGLLAEVRYRVAGWWLLQTDVPLAEVGFLSGYADQPHLTRSFRVRSGMTPDAFRKAFAVGA